MSKSFRLMFLRCFLFFFPAVFVWGKGGMFDSLQMPRENSKSKGQSTMSRDQKTSCRCLSIYIYIYMYVYHVQCLYMIYVYIYIYVYMSGPVTFEAISNRKKNQPRYFAGSCWNEIGIRGAMRQQSRLGLTLTTSEGRATEQH